ncbi:MAG TPA: helix-turn-helix domain-containing protein [Syntrophorhabdales bacterium]|nr:helix-turn-helix domain-containing protein [Syntrophorhabdales bacterium]
MDELWDIGKLAQYLRMKRSTIYAMICRKRIPVVKISGRCVRFRESDIERWLESRTIAFDTSRSMDIRERPRKTRRAGKAANAFVDDIVENAKREVLL